MVTYQKPKRKLISDVGDNFTPGKTNISKSEHVKNSIHTVYFLRISKTKIYLKKKKKKECVRSCRNLNMELFLHCQSTEFSRLN